MGQGTSWAVKGQWGEPPPVADPGPDAGTPYPRSSSAQYRERRDGPLTAWQGTAPGMPTPGSDDPDRGAGNLQVEEEE